MTIAAFTEADEAPFDPLEDVGTGEAVHAVESAGTGDPHAFIRARFPATDLAALLSEDRPPRRWTVEGFLAEGTSASLVAGAGAGKSLLALHLCLCIASGRPFLGRPAKRRRVLYLDLENTEDDMAERLEALAVTEDQARELVTSGRLVHLCLPPIDPLDTATGGALLAAILDAYGLSRGDVVVLDSTQRIVSGDENTADTWRAFYRHTASGMKRRGLGVVRLDNTGKDETRGARGSSSKRDDVDAEWILYRGKALPDTDGNYFRLVPEKGRMIGALSTIEARYVQNLGGTVSFHGATSQHDRDMSAALRLLDDLGLPVDIGKKAAWQQVKDAPNVPNKPTRRVLWAALDKRREGYQPPSVPPSGPEVPNPVGTPRDPSATSDHNRRSDPQNRGTEHKPNPRSTAHAGGVPGVPVPIGRDPSTSQAAEHLLSDVLGATPVGEEGEHE